MYYACSKELSEGYGEFVQKSVFEMVYSVSQLRMAVATSGKNTVKRSLFATVETDIAVWCRAKSAVGAGVFGAMRE